MRGLAMPEPNARSVLLIVDIQPDFLPGGALGVRGADQIIAPLADVMRSELFTLRVASQDWHPPDHISFASHHGKEPMSQIELYGHVQELWPDHCVQNRPGAELAKGLPWERVSAIIRKGDDPLVDSYSVFRNNWDPQGHRPATGLAGYLRDRGIEDVYIAGLTRDFCVRWSARDAMAAGFNTYVIWDLTRPVDPCDDTAVQQDLENCGVKIIGQADLTA